MMGDGSDWRTLALDREGWKISCDGLKDPINPKKKEEVFDYIMRLCVYFTYFLWTIEHQYILQTIKIIII